jgi:hypothetical protein
MADEIRPHLRDCPMCHAAGTNDEKVYFTKEVGIAHDCEWVIGYSVRCVECGVSIHDEYSDEVVRLWNGEARQEDAE